MRHLARKSLDTTMPHVTRNKTIATRRHRVGLSHARCTRNRVLMIHWSHLTRPHNPWHLLLYFRSRVRVRVHANLPLLCAFLPLAPHDFLASQKTSIARASTRIN